MAVKKFGEIFQDPGEEGVDRVYDCCKQWVCTCRYRRDELPQGTQLGHDDKKWTEDDSNQNLNKGRNNFKI